MPGLYVRHACCGVEIGAPGALVAINPQREAAVCNHVARLRLGERAPMRQKVLKPPGLVERVSLKVVFELKAIPQALD